LERLGGMLDAIQDGDPAHAQATDAEMKELEAILAAA
jgi:hypothetical protein